MEILLQTLTNGVLSSLILILIASGLCLIFGILNIVNFAHGEFYMLGGFGIWWIFGVHPIPGIPIMLNYFLAMIVTMAFVAIVGILVEKFIYRPVHDNHASLMIISLGIMFILQAAALVLFGPEDKSVRSPFGGIIDLGLLSFSKERLAAMICAVVVIVALYFFINRTKVGKAMRAVAGDPEAALVQGIPTGKIFSIAMGVCCAIAGAGGV
ncbi:MAG: branched-chain amino acid ABC transporter permease, partial [Deltaproteobacteria bacterium]|nr:branched-chain amino acid ABC transporter permease [Deltaproteobacteria bacterium]